LKNPKQLFQGISLKSIELF